MKKFFKFIIKIILIFIIVLALYFFVSGYIMYKQAINNMSLEDKVDEITSSDNYVELHELPEYYYNAVIAIEDKRFFEHGPLDFGSIFRAVITNIKDMNFTEGGSSITQQLAKNLYFSQEKKIERKVAEVFVAYELEKKYTKEKILELYINVIYYGDGYNGIYSASQGYFDKDPSELTLYEATLLCGIPNAPSVYALSTGNKYIYERQKQVISCMMQQGYITNDEANSILEEGVEN